MMMPAIQMEISPMKRLPGFRKRRRRWTEYLPAQKMDDNHCKETVEQRERQERNDELGHGSHRILRAHHPMDDPGLPAHLRDGPARLDGNDSERTASHDQAQE